MLGFVRGLGFSLASDPDDPTLVLTTLDLGVGERGRVEP